MRIACDFHIHSCLSPCGDLEASPNAIAAAAKKTGLEFVALTDHNSALNAPAFDAACRQHELLACFGIELTTSEELHMLCIFAGVAAALDFGSFVYERLIPIPHDPEGYGDQVYLDNNEVILGSVEKSLLAATTLPMSEAVSEVRARGGLAIPAHVDRGAFSVYSQLGFLPRDRYSAVELFHTPPKIATGDYPAIRNSDAHHPQDVGTRRFFAELPGSDARDSTATLGFSAVKAAIENGAVST